MDYDDMESAPFSHLDPTELDKGFCKWIEDGIESASNELDPSTRLHLDTMLSDAIKRNTGQRRRRFILYVAAAAVLAFTAGGCLTWMLQRFNTTDTMASMTVTTGPSEKARVTLPDGTNVTVNDQSSITYVMNPISGQREVDIDGEALFDVAHDEEHPMIVRNGSLTVRCLGTAFDFKAYHNDPVVTVALTEGKICASAGNSSITINPNNMIEYHKGSGKVSSRKVVATDYTEWTSGYLRFNNESLESICRTLQRHYGVEIRVDGQLGDEHISGSVGNCPVEDVLRMITLTSGHSFHQVNDSIYAIIK